MADIIKTQVYQGDVEAVLTEIKPVLEKQSRHVLMMTGFMIAIRAMKPGIETEELIGAIRGLSEWLSLYLAEVPATKQ